MARFRLFLNAKLFSDEASIEVPRTRARSPVSGGHPQNGYPRLDHHADLRKPNAQPGKERVAYAVAQQN